MRILFQSSIFPYVCILPFITKVLEQVGRSFHIDYHLILRQNGPVLQFYIYIHNKYEPDAISCFNLISPTCRTILPAFSPFFAHLWWEWEYDIVRSSLLPFPLFGCMDKGQYMAHKKHLHTKHLHNKISPHQRSP
jgi:hypothetical protein